MSKERPGKQSATRQPVACLESCPDDPREALEWIQVRAAVLASDYASIRRQLTNYLGMRREMPDDVHVKHSVSAYSELHQEYRSKIRPLYLAVLHQMPDWADAAFQRHCEGQAAVEADLDAATAQWEELKLEAMKRLMGGSKPSGEADQTTPTDLVTALAAQDKFIVSRKTIQRKVADGTLKDYRPCGAPKNATYLLSEAELARHFPKRY